jgi:hypothetical protein
MIKTFISTSPEELDKLINDFMRVRKQNLPVRTEVWAGPNGVYHKATVFFDERFDAIPKPVAKDNQDDVLGTGKYQNDPIMKQLNQALIAEEIIAEDQQVEYQGSQKAKMEKLGALWIQANGSIIGTFMESRISMPETVLEKLRLKPGEHADLTMKGQKVVVMGNKFKKTEKHPDLIIFKRRE